MADILGYISKTGHGTYYRETVSSELATLEQGGRKMWTPLVSAADNADARRTAEYWKAEHLAGNERVKVLEGALQHIERVMGPKVPPCCDGCNFEWGEALKTVRAALEASK